MLFINTGKMYAVLAVSVGTFFMQKFTQEKFKGGIIMSQTIVSYDLMLDEKLHNVLAMKEEFLYEEKDDIPRAY